MPQVVSMAPLTLTVQPQAGSDDAEEKPNGRVNRSSSDLELIEDVDAGIVQVVGIRFPTITMPPAATIVDARLLFYSG